MLQYTYDRTAATNHVAGKEALYGHRDMNSAYVVEDYPYGFRLRCTIRYWLETNGKGTRFISQTQDPRNGKWNKPKASVYSIVGAMYLDEKGYVHYESLGQGSDLDKALNFVRSYPKADLKLLASFCKHQIRMTMAVWSINGVAQELTEEEIGERRVEMSQWKDLYNRIK